MEDQQPAAGHLTDEAGDGSDQETTQAEASAAEPTDEAEPADETEPAATESDEAASEEDSAQEPAEATPKAKKKKEKKKREKKKGRVAAVIAAAAAILFVGSAAFAGATVQPYLSERATVEVKVKVARAAANAVTALWSYTPENMDTLADRAGRYLAGDFSAQYRKFVEEKVVGPNKQYKMTNSTEVTGVAVETLDGPNAVVIVYTNTTSTTPLKKNIPSLQYLAYLMTMKREGDRWLVTRMNTITSLDVTPHV
ncbi:mammalian cell entry protein [Mycobacterium asiaticum]|uniref:Mammalian cell entry protein n=1 Tax=Mycobacterium asiaticum TaxID=1790 RepID=A0A1A3NVG8_MYCAS|nr:mammalian cell entry protein [Mycobacterium asiaticum]OBK25405.1 mammalian cell entry protein [Mycobacterium asiaticum]